MQKLSISGYALKWNVNTVTRGSLFSLTSFLKAEIFVVCTVLRNSVAIARNYSLKLLTKAYLTGHTKRMKSSKKLIVSVRNDSFCDSPCECFKGWSLIGLIASIKDSLLCQDSKDYRRGVTQW
jgi:hypothetical protein